MKKFFTFLYLFLAAPAFAADLTITPANIIVVSGHPEVGTAGVTVTAGQLVYKDATDGNKIKLADANLSDAAATAVGVSLSGASAGQPVTFMKEGDLGFGAILVVGQTYVCSANGGGIAPIGDLATGWRLTYCGYAVTTSTMRLMVKPTGVVAP